MSIRQEADEDTSPRAVSQTPMSRERDAEIARGVGKVTMIVSNDNILNVSGPSSETRASDHELKGEAKSLKRIAREAVELAEKQAITDNLAKSGGNVTRAAKLLGISRPTLQNKMKLYGLRSPKE